MEATNVAKRSEYAFIYITYFIMFFSFKIETNKTINKINAAKKLKNGINGTFKINGFPKLIVKAATISKAAINML